MKEKETYDVSELNIDELHPEIYNKLVDTCDSVAWDVAIAETARDAHYYDEDDTFLYNYKNIAKVNTTMMNRRKISEDGSPCLYGRGQEARFAIYTIKQVLNYAGMFLNSMVLRLTTMR